MNKRKYENHIGVFDSGVGGITILKALYSRMPYEDFIYYGDSANAPYGEKMKEEIEELSVNIASNLVSEGVKALVIACNTATSAAAPAIRAKYPDMPVIGEEPALKPASLKIDAGKVLVMATPATLKLKKFNLLLEKVQQEVQTEFIMCSCNGLASAIEKGDPDSPEVQKILHSLLDEYAGHVDGIVLGCTHYPFVAKSIKKIMGNIPLFEGAEGTARELEKELAEKEITGDKHNKGKICFESSINSLEEIREYEKLYEYYSL